MTDKTEPNTFVLFANGAKGKRTVLKEPHPLKVSITLVEGAINVRTVVEAGTGADKKSAEINCLYPEIQTIDGFTEIFKLKPGKTVTTTAHITAWITNWSIFNVFESGRFKRNHLEIKLDPPKKRKSRAKSKEK